MKKSVVILISTIFLINSGIFILTYYYRLEQIKQRSGEKISREGIGICSDKAVLLKFESKTLSGNKNFVKLSDDEFFYNGNLYDIISQNETFDSIIFYCIHDTEEEDFQRSMYSYFRGAMDPEKNIQQANREIQNYSSIFLPQFFITYEIQKDRIFMRENNSITNTGYIIVPAPPPRICT